MSPEPIRAGWIGPPPSLTQQVAAFWVGVMGVMFAGVGPLLLGGLEATGRLTAAQLGQAGTVELLSMGVAASLAGPLLGAQRLRLIAVVCGLLMAGLNLVTTQVGGDMLTLVRALTGLPSGVMIWLVTGMIVRSPRPERGSGLYLTIQTLAQLLVVAGVSAFVLKPLGVDGGFAVLAGLALLSAAAGLVVPDSYWPLTDHDQGPGGLPSPRGWVALAATFAFQAFILAFWIYVEPLSRQSGHAPAIAGIAISLSLAAQVAGGSAATALAGRVSWFKALAMSIGLMIATLFLFGARPAAPLFLAGSGVFGFLWIFAAPYLTPLAIEADPTRRAAMLGPGASLLGCSAGPFLASLLVSDTDVRGAIWLAVGLALLTLGLIVGLHLTRARAVLRL
ncbi:MFS transporter [Phenylobacterium aquaticum]|uniref:MFS transporter n=1 Tax=Phenylobacterium aquaticum TaxID=1763816 RepID=UPI0026EBD237|nr:MFS transporter [Phenylobacterium aquaticum]